MTNNIDQSEAEGGQDADGNSPNDLPVASQFASGMPAGAMAASSFPFVDPSVFSTTTAAAVAAVAAAAQQLAQRQSNSQPLPSHAAAAQNGLHPQVRSPTQGSGVSAAAVAGLHAASSALHQGGSTTPGNMLNHAHAQGQPQTAGQSVNTQLAALFGSGVMAGGSSSLPFSLAHQAATPSPTAQSHLMGGHGMALPGMPSAAQPNFSAAAHVAAAAHAAAATSSGTMANTLLPNMQNWPLEQLEQHVNLLHQMKQPIPQHVALLLSEARRKEEKRTAKRVANRKSACTSRARKKALVEEMTRTNARLRRQALILSLLPDLVIAITPEGEITFCSAQVERVLRRDIGELIGSNLQELLVPDSRTSLRKLIGELTEEEKGRDTDGVATGRQRKRKRQDQNGNNGVNESKAEDEDANGGGNENVAAQDSGSGGESSGAAVVSDPTFPMTVVKVDSKQAAGPTEEQENSDLSSSGKARPVASSLTTTLTRSPTASSADNSNNGGEDANGAADSGKQPKSEAVGKKQRLSSSDDSSSLSSEAKKLQKANENLERNVRWHNKKMLGKSKSAAPASAHKDDVTGASVTPNNATARLSSLQHLPELSETKKENNKTSRYESTEDQSSSEDSLLAGVEDKKKKASKNRPLENSSDDSGYRESNDASPEETSSSASDSSNSVCRRPKPLAPTCTICLIRDDLTTVWCEVTSSIRSRSLQDEVTTEATPQSSTSGKTGASKGAPRSGTPVAVSTSGSTPPSGDISEEVDDLKELLLCLRPIRDGKKVDETLRFTPKSGKEIAGNDTHATQHSAAPDDNKDSTGESPADTSSGGDGKGPPKKRQHVEAARDENQAEVSFEQTRGLREPMQTRDDTEQMSVVESLILISKKSQN